MEGGLSASAASWVLLACFIGGVLGIQTVSRCLHHFIPSHAVNCDHTHEEIAHDDSRPQKRGRSHPGSRGRSLGSANGKASEFTPLLSPENGGISRPLVSKRGVSQVDGSSQNQSREAPRVAERRPSMIEVPQRILSFVKDTKSNCDEEGPCYGYTDPCGQGCLMRLGPKAPTVLRVSSSNRGSIPVASILDGQDLDHAASQGTASERTTREHSPELIDETCELDKTDLEAQHHHHVPENAFMSIGLQTSIAIALHKLPEGFITYATNHVNPTLGFSVFTALFIHNISEGFALALPLFLALHSRVRAIFWAFILGSVSQPVGAGIAVAWFKIAGRGGLVPGSVVYGCMFAVTSGIMASVALTLLLEGLSLNHNSNTCITYGFAGMAIMGISNALTAS